MLKMKNSCEPCRTDLPADSEAHICSYECTTTPKVEHLPSGATVRWHHGAEDQPTLVVWPAMGVPARKYRRFAERTCAGGLSVVTADYRGQEDSAVQIARSNRFGYRDIAAQDMRQVFELVRSRGSGQPVYLVGHSLGGQLAAVLEHEHPGLFDGLVLVASGTPHWRAFRGERRLTPLVVPPVFAMVARARGHFDGRRVGFGRQSTVLIADWARMARTGSWRRDGHALPARELPLLALSFASDRLAPETAIDALTQQFPAATVTRRHLSRPAGHVGWLREPDAVVDAVRGWLDGGVRQQRVAGHADDRALGNDVRAV